MADEGDGVEQALTTSAAMALAAAARAGEQLARVREQAQRAAQHRAQQAARDTAGRVDAERQAARAYFEAVGRPEFIEHASRDDLQAAHRQAQAWRDADERAAQAERALAAGHQQRFGGAPERRVLATEAQAAALAVAAETSDRAASSAQADVPGADPQNPPGWQEVGRYYGGDTSPDGQAPTDGQAPAAGAVWDSPERREELARTLQATVDNPAAVSARLSADVAQGRPAQDAVAPDAGRLGGRGHTPTAAPGRQTGVER